MTATERVWLVDRTYNDKGMVSLVYATVERGTATSGGNSPRGCSPGPT